MEPFVGMDKTIAEICRFLFFISEHLQYTLNSTTESGLHNNMKNQISNTHLIHIAAELIISVIEFG